MRTHGHRKGSITHWGLLGEVKGRTEGGLGGWGGITWGAMPDIGYREMEATTHIAMYITMQ